MTTVEVLKAARAKIEQGWCQGSYARNAMNEKVLYRSVDACRWCAMGAIVSLGGVDWITAADVIKQANAIEVIPKWNDAPNRTQAEVLAAFDKAIELASS